MKHLQHLTSFQGWISVPRQKTQAVRQQDAESQSAPHIANWNSVAVKGQAKHVSFGDLQSRPGFQGSQPHIKH